MRAALRVCARAPDLPLEPVTELVGVFVSGCRRARGGAQAVRRLRRCVVLAWAAGLGGGMLRDVLVGAVPPVGIVATGGSSPPRSPPVSSCTSSTRGSSVRDGSSRCSTPGRSRCSPSSARSRAWSYGAAPVASVFVGVFTGVGGGVLRDLLTGEVPVVLHHRQLYAIPSLLGAVAIAGLWAADAYTTATSLLVVGGIFALRVLSLRFHLHAPGPWRGRAGWHGEHT